MNFFNNIAGIIAPIVVGFIIDRTGSFALNFLIAGAILVVGILCYLLLLGKIEQIQRPGDQVPHVDSPMQEPPIVDRKTA